MGIYLPDMEMPTSCLECALNYDCFKCIVTGTPFFDHEHHFDDETTRLDNCPLVPVPKHGRLIEEADAIKTVWMILNGLGYRKEENPQLEQTVHEVFATAPTIEVE